MNRRALLFRGVCVALALVAGLVWLGLSSPGLSAFHAQPFDEAELFFEQNATDGDLGLHFKVDGEGWRKLSLFTPRRRKLVDVRVKGNLGKKIGLTEIFSESAEPSFDELPPEEFLALFPAGEYRFIGRTLDRVWLTGTATLTQDLPAAGELISPEEDAIVDSNVDLTVEWEPVPDPSPPESVIEFYEVIVEKDEDEERLRVFRADMLATDTSVRCPAEFLEPGKEYKVEILAQETSGNRTAIEVPFSTAE